MAYFFRETNFEKECFRIVISYETNKFYFKEPDICIEIQMGFGNGIVAGRLAHALKPETLNSIYVPSKKILTSLPFHKIETG